MPPTAFQHIVRLDFVRLRNAGNLELEVSLKGTKVEASYRTFCNWSIVSTDISW